MPKQNNPLPKKFENIIQSIRQTNIYFKSWIDTVIGLHSNAGQMFERLKKDEKQWTGPVFGHNINWLTDFSTQTNLIENLTLRSIYSNIFSKTDSIVARFFSVDFSLSRYKGVQEFFHFTYYKDRDAELKKFRKKGVRFSETIFKYHYLLKTPNCLFDYQPLIDRIDLSSKKFRDSYEKGEYLDKILPDLYIKVELPHAAERLYTQLNETQNKFMGIKNKYNWGSFNLKETLSIFNSDGRKLRNELVHYEVGKQGSLELDYDDILLMYNISEHIEYCIVLNLMFNIDPGSIKFLDYYYEDDESVFKEK